MASASTNERYCPSCGETTARPFCPADGVATLERKRLDVDAAAVHMGDIIGGRYRVTGVLGKGGFGAVYGAEHTGTQQPVALKMLLSAGEASEDEVRRFHREAQVTAQLRHPNTVRVFDVAQTDAGALYLAMELLHGVTLEDELKRRGRAGEVLREDEAIDIGASILRSLSEAHGKGLVHRDLKPANIMLTDVDGEQIVKVLDFGIARQHDSSLTGEGRTLGTPAYMSPEQCRGAEVDGRSDLYALGVILYRCVVGQPPFGDTNPMALIFKHTSEPPPDLRSAARTEVSEAFVATVMRALAKRPADRFADARAMRDALLGVRAGVAPAVGTASFRVGLRGGDTMDDIDVGDLDVSDHGAAAAAGGGVGDVGDVGAYDATLDSDKLAAAAAPGPVEQLLVFGQGTQGARADVEHSETLSVTTSQRLTAASATVTVGRTAPYVEPA